MSTIEQVWQNVCDTRELMPFIGVRALLGERQLAIFRVNGELYAISAIDPFTRAAVLARGLVGDIQGRVVVASPVYKQHFDLATGECLEDDTVHVATYPIREVDGVIQICPVPQRMLAQSAA